MKLASLLRLTTTALLVVSAICSSPCHAQQPPTGTLAAIQTANGNSLTSVNGGGLGGPNTGAAAVPVHTDASVAGSWETFTIIWLNSSFTQFALKTLSGNYVTAVNGGGIGGPNSSAAPIHTDAKAVGPWETLRVNLLPNNQATINYPMVDF